MPMNLIGNLKGRKLGSRVIMYGRAELCEPVDNDNAILKEDASSNATFTRYPCGIVMTHEIESLSFH